MLILPIPQAGNKISILIILEHENLERIRKHDNAEIHWSQIARMYPNAVPGIIGIAYASDSEMVQVQNFAEAGDIKSALKLLTSGFQYKPESGDHDFGPAKIGGKSS